MHWDNFMLIYIAKLSQIFNGSSQKQTFLLGVQSIMHLRNGHKNIIEAEGWDRQCDGQLMSVLV